MALVLNLFVFGYRGVLVLVPVPLILGSRGVLLIIALALWIIGAFSLWDWSCFVWDRRHIKTDDKNL